MQNFLLNMFMMLEETSGNVAATAKQVNDILKGIAGPILSMLGSAGVIYAIVLGVQYAKAEDDGKRTEIKKRAINTIWGVFAIFFLAALCLLIKWDSVVNDIFGYVWKTSSDAAASIMPVLGGLIK